MKAFEDVIIKPVLTEKTYGLIDQKRYVFVVNRRANKTEIKQACEALFGVKVEKVNTVTTIGRIKRQGRSEGRTPTVKKAYVVLKEDSKPIEFFEGMAQ